MSNLAVWSRPAWGTDRWLRDFFGPAAAADWNRPVTSGFRPAADIVKDGDDAVVRLELPGVDVEKDVNVEVDSKIGGSRLGIHGELRGEPGPHPAGDPLRIVPPVVPTARPRHQRGHHGFLRRRRADGTGHRRICRNSGAEDRDHQVIRRKCRSGGVYRPRRIGRLRIRKRLRKPGRRQLR
jgi:hypothetical protein